ncbi:hypothetical protein FHW17_003896 [Phyllobacterium sp. P30BS-XVII]|nr:hypothetical protein [Phyllobacterium sp. P30BS-XVII]
MILGNDPAAWALIITQLATTQIAATLPVNPERPLNPVTCEEAQKRVQEARDGSPLLSPEENKRVLHEAIKRAEQLCK